MAQVEGVGLALRREFIDEMLLEPHSNCNFLEIAPENWLGVGGRHKNALESAVVSYPLVAHGLSLSIGSPAPLDNCFLTSLKQFLDTHRIELYSEHLSYCSDLQGQLYDLMPVPFTDDAVKYVASRITDVQQRLERCLIIENVSYYAAPAKSLTELEFLTAVLQESGCELLLDINNVYVNSINHQYCPYEFIKKLPQKRIRYLHVAGHMKQSEQLLIDTHGEPVSQSVWALLDFCYQQHGLLPTVLERDSNIPKLAELEIELNIIKQYQNNYRNTHV